MTNIKTYEGKLVADGLHFAIVVSRFNRFITEQLLLGAQDALNRYSVHPGATAVAWVPGAFEINLAVKKFAKTKLYDGIIALGSVIRGETTHYDYICTEVAKGIASISLSEEIPVIFGVLTTDTVEQAIERAGIKCNKGYESAVNAIEMGNLLKQFIS